MARLLTLPVMPNPPLRKTPRKHDNRYIDGQRLLVGAMRYLAQEDPRVNKGAIMLLSEHFRTQFRMEDRPYQV